MCPVDCVRKTVRQGHKADSKMLRRWLNDRYNLAKYNHHSMTLGDPRVDLVWNYMMLTALQLVVPLSLGLRQHR